MDLNILEMNGWLNIYKPKGISSAKAVSFVKRIFKNCKVGHTGTLDVEAQGVLPIAIGEATKLVSILIESKKTYQFTVKFGQKRDTGDSSGKIIDKTNNIPKQHDCENIAEKFIGKVEQIPSIFSAIKVGGRRSYQLARNGESPHIKSRIIEIFELKCTNYDEKESSASYLCVCSKGTYIRSLAEDISLSLQSLGYVIELTRLGVGKFVIKDAINVTDLGNLNFEESSKILESRCLKIDYVLDDIPVLEADEIQTKKIRFGQICHFKIYKDYDLVWVRNNDRIVSIGSLVNGNFISSRVFNL